MEYFEKLKKLSAIGNIDIAKNEHEKQDKSIEHYLRGVNPDQTDIIIERCMKAGEIWEITIPLNYTHSAHSVYDSSFENALTSMWDFFYPYIKT